MMADSNHQLTVLIMIFGLVAKFCSLFYVWKRLKISTHIIRILVISIVIAICLQAIGLFGHIWFLVEESKSVLQCSLMYLTFPTSSINIAFMTLLISAVRFHMANRTKNNLRIRHSVLKWGTYGSYAFLITLVSIILYLAYFVFEELPLAVKICMENPHESLAAQLLFMFWGAFGTACFIGAFALDIMLAAMIKKRAQIQPQIRLISWSRNAEIKTTIPLRSSFLSLAYFWMAIILGKVFSFRQHLIFSSWLADNFYDL